MERSTLERRILDDDEFKKELKSMMRDAIEEYFRDKGKMTFSVIVGASLFAGALSTFLHFFGSALALFGFSRH